MTPHQHVEHFFRHEYGRLVAILSCRIGVQHMEDIEDAVQSALMTSLETWPLSGSPDNPSAWLFRVARNKVMEILRQRTNRRRILDQYLSNELDLQEVDTECFLPNEVRDDLLRMLFVCCDDSIPVESQLVLSLKILCGFDVREIGLRLFTTESNVYKRLGRARSRIRELPLRPGDFSVEQFKSRLPAVHQVLYLLFTEGHLSSQSEMAIRQELCKEAIRLAAILADHPVGQTSETSALLSLMHFHFARLSSRKDSSDGLLLLDEQNRNLWDQDEIKKGLKYLGESAHGDVFSRYHAEAGIAAEHCLASSFKETRWSKIVEHYELLESMSPSVLHMLNRALAVAEWKGPAEGLEILDGFEPPTWLAGSYMWSAVLCDLHRRCNHIAKASQYREIALNSAPTPAVRKLLMRRLQMDSIR